MKAFRTWLASQSRPARFVAGAIIMALVTIVLELIFSDGPLSRHIAPIIGGAIVIGAWAAWRPARVN
jgi:hypothetical protein